MFREADFIGHTIAAVTYLSIKNPTLSGVGFLFKVNLINSIHILLYSQKLFRLQ